MKWPTLSLLCFNVFWFQRALVSVNQLEDDLFLRFVRSTTSLIVRSGRRSSASFWFGRCWLILLTWRPTVGIHHKSPCDQAQSVALLSIRGLRVLQGHYPPRRAFEIISNGCHRYSHEITRWNPVENWLIRHHLWFVPNSGTSAGNQRNYYDVNYMFPFSVTMCDHPPCWLLLLTTYL